MVASIVAVAESFGGLICQIVASLVLKRGAAFDL